MYKIKTKKLSCYLTNSGYGDKIIKQVAESLNAPVYPATAGIQPGLVFNWGILRGGDMIIKTAKNTKREFVYIDHAYFNAGHTTNRPAYRIVKNELQLTSLIKRPADRFEQLNIKVRPWRKSGEYILVCPPSPATVQFYDLNYDWSLKTTTILKQITDIPLYIRHKPGAFQVDTSRGYAVPTVEINAVSDKISLETHLERAYAVVTFNSSVAITAICAGVPVIVDKVSAAAPISRTSLLDIENLLYPDREEWLYGLAYGQFYLDELATGLPWKILDI